MAILGDVLRDEEQYRLVIAAGRALVRTGHTAEARALCDACLALFAKCAPSRKMESLP